MVSLFAPCKISVILQVSVLHIKTIFCGIHSLRSQRQRQQSFEDNHGGKTRNISTAYQASLVEPPWRDQTSLICRRRVPKRYNWVFNVCKFSPKSGDMFGSYGNKICQASYRVAREENNTRQQTAEKHQLNLN